VSDLNKAAKTALLDCMALGKDETLLVLTDDRTMEVGMALFEAGRQYARESVLLLMKEREINGQEPPAAISAMMQEFDVVICPTGKSLTHTNARRQACKAGARVATMPGISPQVMIRTLKADYHKIAERTRRLTKILDDAHEVHITTALGTDILLPVEGIQAISSTGLITEKGSFGNLPSGESYLMPAEGKTEGIFIVDGSFAGVGKITGQPLIITVEKGFAVKIDGGQEAAKLNALLIPFGKKAFNTAELGIGTNDEAIITGEILEDEKVMGTVHIALGNNLSMGGTCDVGIHLDGVILKPTVIVDGRTIMANGDLLVD